MSLTEYVTSRSEVVFDDSHSDPRNHLKLVNFRLPVEDWSMLKACAESLELSLSEFLRIIVSSGLDTAFNAMPTVLAVSTARNASNILSSEMGLDESDHSVFVRWDIGDIAGDNK